MATDTKKTATATLTRAEKAKAKEEPTVRIMLPLLEGGDTDKVDQTENATVNGKTMVLKRGVWLDLPCSYYLALKQSGRYPNI